ncbi:MAG: T9SS type A sorting domain-containing protein [Candidatus Latescibacteria bacterium]|nr:T9SS type A sorting domain-containing protein [Candidatus Latescibacterota bacterium]
MNRSSTIGALLLLGLLASGAGAVSIAVQKQGGEEQFVARIGEILDLEVLIDAGGEELTGYTFFLSYDPKVFGLVPASQSADGQAEPFAPGEFLLGLVLLNQVEELEGENLLSFATAVGVQRSPRTGAGVAARFRLEVLRRPQGEQASLRLEERGQRHVSHYTAAARRGVEQRFAPPLGEAVVRITGFRVRPLPDLSLVEGEEKVVFDLDDFTDQDGTQVIWTASRLSEIPTRIDPETGLVTMQAQAGLVGERRMIFTALESVEGLTAADTIRIAVFSRPRIEGLPDTVLFPEDGTHQRLDLDAFVEDLDDRPVSDSLSWEAAGNAQVQVEINPASHIPVFSAAPDWFGEEVVQLIVRDGEGNADTAAVKVVVAPVNDPPVVLRPGPVYPLQGEEPVRIPLAELVADKDDDLSTLHFELRTEGGVSAEISGDALLIRGDAQGRGVVRFSVQDTSGAQDQGRQVAVVLAPGKGAAPQIQGTPALRFPAGGVGQLSLDSLAWDEGPAGQLQWQAEAGEHLRAEVVGGQLQVGAESGFSGQGQLTLKVRDAQGNQDEVELQVEVIPEGQPLGPQIRPPGKIGLAVGQWKGLALDPLVEDPDDADEQLAWSWLVDPEGAVEDSVDLEGRRLYLRAGTVVDPASLVLKVADPLGNADEQVVPLLISAPDEAPRLRPFEDVKLETSSAQGRLDLDDYVFDGEDREEELAWTAAAPPGVEVEVNPASHLLKVRRADVAGDTNTVVQVALQVRDTQGKPTSALLQVQLPPVFELKPFPQISFFANQVDTTLALDEYVIASGPLPSLEWSAAPSQNLRVQLDPQPPHRVRLQVVDPTFQGSETLNFTALDQTGRQRSGPVEVRVENPGLVPQLRPFPRIDLRRGEVNTSLDLDDYAVDDDPDSALKWSASAPASVQVEIDTLTHVVSLSTQGSQPALEEVRFLVADPAGNAATGILEVAIVQAGEPPQLSPLPQIRLDAGGPEQRLGLDAFVADADTPDDSLSWEVSAEQGVEARIEDRQLLVAVPAGQAGSAQVRLRVKDPEGNQAQGIVLIEVATDTQAPELEIEVRRHPLFAELLEVEAQASEELREAPQILVGQTPLEVEAKGAPRYAGYYQIPRQEGEQFLDIVTWGFDRAGNEVRDSLSVALRWMDRQGGSLGSPDAQLALNAGDEAAGPGNLALIYRKDPRQVPPGGEAGPVYAVDLARGRDLLHPVSLNFYVGAGAPGDLGVLRWDEPTQTWEELPTSADPGSGWLSAAVDRLGLFRVGQVSLDQRRENQPLTSYPNPFSAAKPVRIVYEVGVPGPVRVEIFNMLGQSVRVLVDENFQDVGTWSASWDGRDQAGQRLASGLYICRLQQPGAQRRQLLLLVH